MYFKAMIFVLASHTFPFVKKRIDIVDKREMVLQPIEVAIDEMQKKVLNMREIVNQPRTDIIKLQLLLAGCVNSQVWKIITLLGLGARKNFNQPLLQTSLIFLYIYNIVVVLKISQPCLKVTNIDI